MDQNLHANGLVNALLAGHFPRILLLGMAALITSGFVGCGGGGEAPPKLASVKGKITINGLPAPDLAVTFESQVAGGGRSGGVTNALGEYELSYAGSSPSPKGAAIGQHLVRISSAATSTGTLATGGAGGSPTDLGPTDDKVVPAIVIPEEYNAASGLKVNVLAGDNPPINFDVKIPKN